MLVDSHRGHFSAASGIGMLANRARSAIEPGLIDPAPPAPWGCGGAVGCGGGGAN